MALAANDKAPGSCTIALLCLLIMAGGAIIFFYQCGFWLKEDTWVEVPLWKAPAFLADLASFENMWDGWDGNVTTSLKGLKMALEWILRLPAALFLVVSGFIGLRIAT